MSATTDDEFDFAEFTEDELRAIDLTAEAAYAADSVVWPVPSPGPGLATSFENGPYVQVHDARSRKSSGFSVFDLTEEELRLLDESVARLESDQAVQSTSEAEPGNTVATESLRPPTQHVEISFDSPIPSALAVSPAPTLGRSPNPSPTPITTPSLYSQFRLYRRALSVSDIVGPSWCEVQFDYGLRGGRHLPVEKRPAVLKTREGKIISVRKDVAVKNDVVMKSGTAVHKKLEREIRPVEVVVTTKTREDGWGLKIFNMLSNMRILTDEGRCREMPVMGFVHGHFISGVIDEIIHTPIPPLSPSIPGHFPRTEQPSSLSAAPSHTIHILDNKTRAVPSKPKARDTLQSRLQLMLYKRLLDALLEPQPLASCSTSPPVSSPRFSFASIWEHYSLNPFAPFSPRFLEDSALLVLSNDLGAKAGQARCLNDLESVWETMLKELAGGGRIGDQGGAVSKSLKLVYRRRGPDKFKKRLTAPSSSSSETSQSRGALGRSASSDSKEKGTQSKKMRAETEDVGLQRAIQASLKPSSTDVNVGAHEDTVDVLQAEQKDQNDGVERVSEDIVRAPGGWVSANDGLQRAIQDSITTYKTETGRDASPPPMPPSFPPAATQSFDRRRQQESDEDIIGTFEFEYDDAILDDHLRDVLDFWHDRRPPKGVAMEDTGRCRYCEFSDGCEWRETKAAEIVSSAPQASQTK